MKKSKFTEQRSILTGTDFPLNRLPNSDDISSSEDRCRRRWACLRLFMAEGNVGAELGVFKGNFIDYMLAMKPAKLYLVDPWFRGYKKWHWASGNKSPIAAITKLLTVFHKEIEAGILEPRIQFSSEFLSGLPDNHLDWVYIDTNHTYETTISELTLAIEKVKPTGYIMGDDFFPDPKHKFHGVYEAVKEFEAAKKLIVIVNGVDEQFVATHYRSGSVSLATVPRRQRTVRKQRQSGARRAS